MRRCESECGFTLIELMVAMLLAGLILAGTSSLVKNAFSTDAMVQENNELLRDARFAMQRMTSSVRDTPILTLPLPDNPATGWRENIREETVPASPPEGGSFKATAVLAVGLSDSIDLDADGFPDADNDRDGHIDEDYPADMTFDSRAGVYQIDDNGDGFPDNSFYQEDDDESFFSRDEDPINGNDDDADGMTGEDPGADMNGDGAPGIAGVDDDGDGQVDEGNAADDDEDGAVDEDWLDVVAFYLQGDTLVERHPVPWDATANGSVNGRDYIETVIAEDVTRFRVERLLGEASGQQLVNLTLELTGQNGRTVSLDARVRVGGSQ